MHLGHVPPLFPEWTQSFRAKIREEALLCFLFCDFLP